jgi:hypothetical protein
VRKYLQNDLRQSSSIDESNNHLDQRLSSFSDRKRLQHDFELPFALDLNYYPKTDSEESSSIEETFLPTNFHEKISSNENLDKDFHQQLTSLNESRQTYFEGATSLDKTLQRDFEKPLSSYMNLPKENEFSTKNNLSRDLPWDKHFRRGLEKPFSSLNRNQSFEDDLSTGPSHRRSTFQTWSPTDSPSPEDAGFGRVSFSGSVLLNRFKKNYFFYIFL